MNILKLQDQLKGLPDNALIMHVQNPTGQVPTYLALAELQRRKEMRDNYKTKTTQPEQTVADELVAEATQPPPGLIGLPQAQPMMQAMTPPPEMPVQQMAHGGLADLDVGNMFNEQNYANGGIVAFADGGDTEKHMNLDELPSLNLNSGESNYILPSDMSANQFVASGGLRGLIAEAARRNQGDARALNWMFNLGSQTGNSMYDQFQKQARSRLAEGGEVKHFQQGGPSVADLKYQAALTDSYLDPRYLVAGAKDLVSGNLFGYRVVRDPVTGELIHARDLPSSVDELRKKKKSEVQDLLDKAQKLEDEKKSATSKKENLTELDPTLAAATFNKDALYKDPNMSELYNMARPKVQPLLEKDKIPAGATQAFNPYANTEKPKSKVDIAADTARRFQEMMGPDTEREDLMKKIQALETGAKEQERMAPWLALTKAGFGMAAGKSPFALQNIGEGAQLGISEYVAARDRLDKLNERQLDIRSKLNQVQRGEKAAGVSAGLTKELKQMEEDNANARNQATNQVHLKTAAMAAAKKSDYETYLDLARQDPDNYKIVQDPQSGQATKIFDSGKVTQTYRSFSGSSGLDDDKILAMWQQEKMMDKNFKMSFKDYANMIRSGAGSTTQSITPTKSLNNIFK